MVAPGSGHTGLIPSLSLASGIAEPVQHRGNLVVAVADGHPTNDLQRLRRRSSFGRGSWPFHRELSMHSSLPVNYKLEGPVILITAHNDLFDGGAEDHLLECRRAVVALPHFSKVITH